MSLYYPFKHHFLLLAVIFLLLSQGTAQTRVTRLFSMKDEKPGFTPSEFYIAGVVDDRADNQRNYMGLSAKAVSEFYNSYLPADHALRPVIISIKKLDAIETAPANNRVEGHIKLSMSFGLKREFDTVQLINYNGGITYTRVGAPPGVAEVNTGHVLLSAVNWFNVWINKQADHSPLLAKSVQVKFTDFNQQPEGDTIYYSVNRPIKWDDFKGKPGGGPYAAEVFVSVGYAEHVEVVKGIIYVALSIKTYFPKSAAWVNNNAQTSYALNHEQRHFDIARIIAERFKNNIIAAPLPVENYDGAINVAYLETLRQAYAMQTLYDKETSHGTDNAGQEEWNRRIDEQLRYYGIVKAD